MGFVVLSLSTAGHRAAKVFTIRRISAAVSLSSSTTAEPVDCPAPAKIDKQYTGAVPSRLVAASIILGGMVRRSLVASLTTNSAPAMGTDHDPGSGSPLGNTVGWAPNCCISDSSWLGETDCELNTDHATCRRYGRLLRTATPVHGSVPRLLDGHWLVVFRSAPLSRECGHCWANSNHS